jgi:replicative DNA helicase
MNAITQDVSGRNMGMICGENSTNGENTRTRKPPMTLHNETAELSVIGCLLIDEESRYHCAELMGMHFFDQSCRKYYETILSMIEDGQPLDPVQIASRFKGERWAIDMYTRATDTVSTSKAMEYHVSEVMDAYKRRRFVGACSIASEDARTGADLGDVLSSYQNELSGVVGDSGTLRSGADVAADFWRGLESGKTEDFIKTGIPSLDFRTGGLERGLITVVAARPSMGKSAFAVNLIANIARSGKKVQMSSLEDLSRSVMGRMAARAADVDSMDIHFNRCNREQIKRILDAMNDLPLDSFWIDDGPGQSVGKIRAAATVAKMKHNIDVLIVDHLGILTDDRDEYNSVSENIRGFCEIAKELDIAVVVLHQLNRDLERRDDKRPRLSDLRGSGKIEEFTRTVLMLYRDAVYNRAAPEDELEVIVAKSTHGRTGIVKLAINLSRMAIGDTYSPGPGADRYGY